MTASKWCRPLRLLQLEELDDFLTQSGSWVHQLPPAGMSLDLHHTNPVFRDPDICGYPTSGPGPGTRYWATSLDLAFGDQAWLVRVLARIASGSPEVAAVLGAEEVPWIYDQEEVMRWIRSTFRGTLSGGVEQFQWKIDWGNPGNDPVLGEAEAGAFAQFLAEQFGAAFIGVNAGGVTMQQVHCSTLKYTEVGVASWLQDVGKNADGSGGDAHQEYPTAWYSYAVGSQPTGGSANPSLPNEVSLALTFQTNKRGPRGRGRIYLPPFDSIRTDANGLFTTAVVQSCGEAIGSLFDAVKGSTYAYKPLVVSMREKVLNEVVQIDVGKVPDSQRRRRRSQDEAKITAYSAV